MIYGSLPFFLLKSSPFALFFFSFFASADRDTVPNLGPFLVLPFAPL